MAVPRILKVVVNSGIGKLREKKDAVEAVEKQLALITGQKTSPRPAKKAIASFKTRVGQPLGLKVTLRGKRMEDFLNRLIHVALPRSRDFKGVDAHAVDRNGNLTIGIKEHNIFPEVADTSRVIGLEITCVTNTEDKDASLMLLADLGIPFKKEEKNG